MKPKIWGNIHNAAIALSEIRKHHNIDVPFQTSVSNGIAQTKPGLDEVFIEDKVETHLPILYVDSLKYNKKLNNSIGTFRHTYNKSMPLTYVKIPIMYGGSGLNRPSVYGVNAEGSSLTYLHEYLGKGRFLSFADSGYHISQKRNVNFYPNIYSYNDGSYTYTMSIATYELRSEGNLTNPPVYGFNSGTVFSISKVNSHFNWASLETLAGINYLRYTLLGAWEPNYEMPFKYANLGCDKQGLASAVISTLIPTGSLSYNTDDTAVSLISLRSDGHDIKAQSFYLQSGFDRPFYQFLGPVITLSPGVAICVFAIGLNSTRYYIEMVRESNSDPNLTRFIAAVANNYGLYKWWYGSGINDSLAQMLTNNTIANAGITVPPTPNIQPKDALRLYLAKTTDYGANWSVSLIDNTTIYPDGIPYATYNYVYSYEETYRFDLVKSSNENEWNSLKNMTPEQRMNYYYAGNYPTFKLMWLGWPNPLNHDALLIEKSSMCVIDKNTILWFMQSIKMDQIDTGGGNVTLDDRLLDNNNYMKSLMYKSYDGGNTWVRLQNFPEYPPNIFNEPFETALNMDPNNYYNTCWRGEMGVNMVCLRPNVVIAKCVKYGYEAPGYLDENSLPSSTEGSITRKAVFLRTRDGGSTWSKPAMKGLPSAYNFTGLTGRIKVISANESKSTIAMYVLDGAYACLYTSNDDGDTWKQCSKEYVSPVLLNDPYKYKIDGEGNPHVGWQLITNAAVQAYGYYPMFSRGFYNEILYTGENFEIPPDVALPWRLDATKR